MLDLDKQTQLNDLLESLAVVLPGPEIVADVAKSLKTIYTGEFRHMYSFIFSTVRRVDEDPQKDTELLISNLADVWLYCEENEKDKEFVRKVKKLFDHVNLDVARINTMKAIQDEYKQSLEDVHIRIEDANKKLEGTQKFITGTERKLKETQKEYVAILGIFAAIVVTFVGGMSFSGMTMNKIGEADIFTLLIFLSLIAMFAFNVIKALFDFLLKITDRNDVYDVMSIKPEQANIFLLSLILISMVFKVCR